MLGMNFIFSERCLVFNPEEVQIAKKKLYIMTLGCLAPYRRLGNNTFLLSLLENSSKCWG